MPHDQQLPEHTYANVSCCVSQLGAAPGPVGTCVFCRSREPDNDVAASHCGDGAQLRTVAAPEEPVTGGHATVQPALHLRREEHTHTHTPGLHYILLSSCFALIHISADDLGSML